MFGFVKRRRMTNLMNFIVDEIYRQADANNLYACELDSTDPYCIKISVAMRNNLTINLLITVEIDRPSKTVKITSEYATSLGKSAMETIHRQHIKPTRSYTYDLFMYGEPAVKEDISSNLKRWMDLKTLSYLL